LFGIQKELEKTIESLPPRDRERCFVIFLLILSQFHGTQCADSKYHIFQKLVGKYRSFETSSESPKKQF
jgi:hypothetical protein